MEISRHWRIRKQRYSMVGSSCPSCGFKMFPARDICPECGHGSHASLQINIQESLYNQPVVVHSHVTSA